ncbi:RNA polymerase sigma factor YlaC [Lacunisphaera limnophila]|uniref:RNA polymerase sigma factor YlaC n=1 Tax=Lacunisphaera limnophila TaxID=1838286 RepID=A0A1D8AR32_9BACT|nr:sigma-70 family RNA polymerase sigma factor [Lacunisphaera limnophila]AOS43340.1 RNA polymerase sigma factor YlaC [Lacunisphaera limnophila]
MQAAEQHLLFERWLAEHAAVLHHVVNGFAEGTDRHDLMQELLLAVWRAVPAYRGGAQPSTFIYRVAHNTALTWKRTERNYRRQVDRFEADAWRATHAEPAAGIREREALELLYAQIRRLPPVDRSLILLHLDGVSYAGMAEIHGLTESNVGVKLNRLKQKLTDAMEEMSHELR